MHAAESSFVSLLQDNPMYRFAFIGIAIAVGGIIFYFLTQKLKELQKQDKPTAPDDEEDTLFNNHLLQAFPPHLRPGSTDVPQQSSSPSVNPNNSTASKPVITVFEPGKSVAQPIIAERIQQPVPFGVEPTSTNQQNTTRVPLTSHSNPVTNNQINAILSSLTDLIFEFNEDKVCLNVWYNKSRKLMVDLDGFVGKTVKENIGAENAAEMTAALDAVIQTHEPTTVEFLSFYGSGKWFQAKFNPVFDADGRYTGRITAAVSEISEQKNFSAKLREKHQQLAEAQKIARIGNWWYDLHSKETYWSENLFALLEISSLPAGISHFEYYSRVVHPEDRRAVYQYFANISGGTQGELEHRVIAHNGDTRFFRIQRGEQVRDADGNIVRVTGIIQDVTISRYAERIIKKSQAELLEAQTIAKIGNWKWYFEQKTLSWSDEVYHIHDVPAKQQKQRGLSHFKLLLKHVHPDDKNILLDFLKDPANLRRTSYEYRIITPAGYVKHLSIIIGKVRYNENGTVRNVVGTLQDVTDRKTAELNIQQTEANYKQVLERINLAALTFDYEGRIVFCNQYLANLLGYSQSSMTGMLFFEQFVPENLSATFTDWLKNNQFKSNNVNAVICANGQQRIISWQNTVIHDNNGRIKQVTSIGEDITAQQKDRQNLITAKEEAERSSSFKSEFLSIMSHEIRTPMNAVIGTTNLLLEESPREDQLPYLNNLKFSGENLLSIIDEILDYNKIEAGKLELSKQPVNMHQLIANIRQSFHARAIEKKIGLFTDVDANIPVSLLGDPIRLAQIINNLVSNAIKFTSQGNVTIRVREKQRDANQVALAFTISDTGIGIAPDSLKRIFEPFMQESHSENYGGSGLGLAIVKRLIGLHNSEIKADSILGQGTQFNFTINFEYTAPLADNAPDVNEVLAIAPTFATNGPRKEQIINSAVSNGHANGKGDTNIQSNGTTNGANGPNGDQSANSEVENNAYQSASKQPDINNVPLSNDKNQAPYHDLDGMRVLVVDDNKMNILIANRFLHKWKIQTQEASNGANAVDMVTDNQYDLVIMDLQMPVMDGFEATRLIKQLHPELPIIALTADAMPETFLKAQNAGMDDYMTKPFMPEILFGKVSKYYGQNLVEA